MSGGGERYLIRDAVAVVIDPMGGRGSGEAVAQVALSTIEAELAQSNDLVRAIEAANAAVVKAAEAPTLRGAGCAVSALAVANARASVAWVGDVRVVRLRSGALELLAPAHTLLAFYLEVVALTPEEVENFPHKTVLVRTLGMKATVEVDTMTTTAEVADVFALINDPVWGALGEAALKGTLRVHGSCPRECVAAILDQVAAAGGQGTPTAVVVRVESTGLVVAGGSGGPTGVEAAALRVRLVG